MSETATRKAREAELRRRLDALPDNPKETSDWCEVLRAVDAGVTAGGVQEQAGETAGEAGQDGAVYK